jgi:hypothetical protein
VQLKTQNNTGCVDSSSQNLTIPDFSQISSNNKSKININPNPFNNQLQLTNINPDSKITVFNIHGQLVFECDCVDENQLEINTNKWKSGIYLIKVSDQNELLHFKLVKQ